MSEGDLAAAWSSSLGQTISVEKLYEIVNSISARYAQAGYALSFALLPEQDITEGRVKIAVVEGFVDDVVVEGAPATGGGLSLGHQLQDQIRSIKASKPLKSADF